MSREHTYISFRSFKALSQTPCDRFPTCESFPVCGVNVSELYDWPWIQKINIPGALHFHTALLKRDKQAKPGNHVGKLWLSSPSVSCHLCLPLSVCLSLVSPYKGFAMPVVPVRYSPRCSRPPFPYCRSQNLTMRRISQVHTTRRHRTRTGNWSSQHGREVTTLAPATELPVRLLLHLSPPPRVFYCHPFTVGRCQITYFSESRGFLQLVQLTIRHV
jgi:hypothetical protein